MINELKNDELDSIVGGDDIPFTPDVPKVPMPAPFPMPGPQLPDLPTPDPLDGVLL